MAEGWAKLFFQNFLHIIYYVEKDFVPARL